MIGRALLLPNDARNKYRDWLVQILFRLRVKYRLSDNASARSSIRFQRAVFKAICRQFQDDSLVLTTSGSSEG